MVSIKFFASLREQLGISDITLYLKDEKTLADVRDTLIAQGDKWHLLHEKDLLMAINHTLSDANSAVKDGDELAFFPPVTGG